MPAVPSTNICHVIYEPGITLCPIYYILRYVDGLAILSNRPARQSGHVAPAPTRSAYDGVLRTPFDYVPVNPFIRRWKHPFRLSKSFKLASSLPPTLSLSLSLSESIDYFIFRLIRWCANFCYSLPSRRLLLSYARLATLRTLLPSQGRRVGMVTFDRASFEKSRIRLPRDVAEDV